MFLPPTIDLSQSEKYTLSLRIHPTEFMFSLSKPNEGKNYCLRGTKFEKTNESLLEKIQKIIFELNFLTQQYARTNVVFVSPHYNLVPTEVYTPKKKNELFSLTSQSPDPFILSNPLPRYGAISLYEVEHEMFEFLSRSLYNPHFFNHSTLLVELFEGRSKTKSLHAKMYVNLSDNLVDILSFAGQKLLHAVSYDELTANEKVYYILKIWESLNFNQLHDQLLIAGEMEEEALTVLREYVKNIERVASPSEVFLWHKDAQRAPLDLIYLSL